ncbi:hypothetical protein BurJ1DRAFT_4885 [Burkholderiales bacterium JOSHI_001]|nr:hypothetical protein BurJ1DRAFT_4885 [Burkholderiales bacterium JOSHI_001]
MLPGQAKVFGASQTLLDGIAEPLAFRKAFVQAQDSAQRAA